MPYLTIRHLSNVKVTLFGDERCSALVSGRTHYGYATFTTTKKHQNVFYT
nr:MAG TPA: hypothetical protein [Bacteriophage sp.]